MTGFLANEGIWYCFPYSLLNCLYTPSPDTVIVEYANATVTLKGRNLCTVFDSLFNHRLARARCADETTYPFGASDPHVASIEIKFTGRK